MEPGEENLLYFDKYVQICSNPLIAYWILALKKYYISYLAWREEKVRYPEMSGDSPEWVQEGFVGCIYVKQFIESSENVRPARLGDRIRACAG